MSYVSTSVEPYAVPWPYLGQVRLRRPLRKAIALDDTVGQVRLRRPLRKATALDDTVAELLVDDSGMGFIEFIDGTIATVYDVPVQKMNYGRKVYQTEVKDLGDSLYLDLGELGISIKLPKFLRKLKPGKLLLGTGITIGTTLVPWGKVGGWAANLVGKAKEAVAKSGVSPEQLPTITPGGESPPITPGGKSPLTGGLDLGKILPIAAIGLGAVFVLPKLMGGKKQ